MSKENNPANDTADREIVISRMLNAPRELVFEVWTDPNHLAKWYGPNGFTVTTREMDVRAGGAWRLVMHGPNGVDYPNRIIFTEVVKPQRLAYTHDSDIENDPGQFNVTVTFDEVGEKTRLTMRSVFNSAAERDKVVKEYNAIEGGNQTIDRLEKELAEILAARTFVITRVFNAPRELVFKAWTEPEHFVSWWGPKGFKMNFFKLDLRPGGLLHYAMQSPDGMEMWGRFVYHEILAPERIVFVNSFSDKDGNITRAPFSPTWPLEVMNTLTLTERDGITTLTLSGGPINANDTERKTFTDAFGGMQQGFGGTFDQLDEYLAKMTK